MKTRLTWILIFALIVAIAFTACPDSTSPSSSRTLTGEITITPDTGITIGMTLTAHYSGTEAVTYRWNVDNTAINGATSDTYTPSAAGNYTVTVSAPGYNSKTSAAVAVTDAGQNLSGEVTISPSSFVTVGTPLTATYSGTETVTFQWNVGGTPISGATSATYTPDEIGSYTVTVRADGYNGKTSAEVLVGLRTLAGNLLISPEGTVSVNTLLTVRYDGTEGVTLSYRWQRDMFDISGVTGDTYTPTQTGDYRVIASAAGYTSISSNTVHVLAHVHTGTWTVTRPADPATEGEETRTCNVCGEVETRAIPRTGTPELAFSLIDNHTAWSVSKGTVSGGAVIIPAYHYYDGTDEYLPVTKIADNGFKNTAITSVSIPATVTAIGKNAFSADYGVTSMLSSVTFPADSHLVSIGDEAFASCMNLTSVTIPPGVTAIGDGTFAGCTSLTGITIPAGVTAIGSGAFEYSGLTSIAIPASVTAIGSISSSRDSSFLGAFWSCYNLETVTFAPGSQLRIIGDGTFIGCGFTSIDIPEGVTAIGAGAFEATHLTSITIPASVTAIGGLSSYNPNDNHFFTGAFGDCYNLETVTFATGSRIATIGDRTFYRCTSLTSISIPASNIGRNAFEECTSLKTVTIEASSQPGSIGGEAFYRCSSLERISIAASVRSIGERAFSTMGRNYNTALADVTFAAGSQLQTIGDYAFYNCDSLTSITIPACAIGQRVFMGCGNLATVIIAPSSQPGSIGMNAFEQIYIQSIRIAANVTTIGNRAFYGCYDLTDVIFDANSQLETIGADAFSCTSLTSITIPASVTSIGRGAFLQCDNLAAITVETNSQHYASEGGVLYNKAKTSLIQVPGAISGIFTIPASVTSIGIDAFNYCNLTSVTIPASVTSVSHYSFFYWSSSQTIYVAGHASQASADAAWGNDWRAYCDAVIRYWDGNTWIP